MKNELDERQWIPGVHLQFLLLKNSHLRRFLARVSQPKEKFFVITFFYVIQQAFHLPKGKLTCGAVKMPLLPVKVKLVKLEDCVGPNSHHFFDALSIDTDFLSEPSKTWPQIPKFQTFVSNMLVTNEFTALSYTPK